MAITRREFLKGAAAVAGAGAGLSALELTGCSPAKPHFTKGSRKVKGLCVDCSLGCGITLFHKNKKPLYLEGDADHPVNGGAICPYPLELQSSSPNTNNVIRYRAGLSSSWSDLTWDNGISRIAERINRTRNGSFESFEGMLTVNRLSAITAIAGNSLTNEEAYLFNKFSRLIGIPHVGTQSLLTGDARYSVLDSMFGLAGSTNPVTDLVNSKVILMMGQNAARRSPMIMRQIVTAREKGAKLILLDPVVTESAANVDIFCQIRPCTDAAFLLGMMRYAIENGKINTEYCVEYTDLPFLVRGDFSFDVLTGLSSGFDRASKRYNTELHDYERDGRGNPVRDDELRSARTIFQMLRTQLSLYTPDYVERVTGCPANIFLSAAETFVSSFESSQAGSIVMGNAASGGSNGFHAVRAAASLQLLLGNIGISGGGIFCPGTGNETGVSYQIGDWNALPGGLTLPDSTAGTRDSDFAAYCKEHSLASNDPRSINKWDHTKEYLAALLRAWYGKNATKETRYNYDWLPKSSPFNREEWFASLSSGKYKGALFFGADPFSCGFSVSALSSALSKLEWVVVSGSYSNDSVEFWKNNVLSATEVFFLQTPELHLKSGTVTTSSRWIESRSDNNDMPNAKGELECIDSLYKKLCTLVPGGEALAESVTYANWQKKCTSANVLKEMSGTASNGKSIRLLDEVIKEDDLSCGNILYSGVAAKSDLLERRESDSGVESDIYPAWGFSIPENVRILFNRASLDRKGTPWNSSKKFISSKRTAGYDAVYGQGDFAGLNPFVGTIDGVGRIFVPSFAEGPLPVFYDHSTGNGIAPSHPRFGKADFQFGTNALAVIIGSSRYAAQKQYNGIAEHDLDGVCEISESFAQKIYAVNGSVLTVASSSGEGKFFALVTKRVQPLAGDDCIILHGGTSRMLISNSIDGSIRSVRVSVKSA